VFSHPFRPTHRGRPSRRLARLGGGTILFFATLALIGLPAPAAQASAGGCPSAAASEPFAQWGDAGSYTLVSQGDFEGSLSQWTLGGGARVVAGSEPYGATGAVGGFSLALPAGGSAQSPYTCVTASDPTFRFFARNGNPLSTIAVEVVYKTPLGTLALPLGAVALSGTWQPTQPMLTASVVAGLLSGGTAQLALRFTELTGASQIDDVFIDPRMR
jgi:hypothetical protein